MNAGSLSVPQRYSCLRRMAFSISLIAGGMSASAAAHPLDNPLPQSAAGTIVIDRTFTGDAELPLSIDKPFTRLGVTADIRLDGASGFVRILLVDGAGIEYQLLEANPLLATGPFFSVTGACEEALSAAGGAFRLRIQVKDAEVRIRDLAPSPSSPATALAKASAESMLEAKIALINANLEKSGASWRARVTDVSRMTYARKRALFGGRVPNLQGFEHYGGGIFTLPDPQAETGQGPALSKSSAAASPFAPAFSWRKRHGIDWLTPARNQEVQKCGSCWAFGAIGVTEMMANLWFNKLLDLDLSEQEIVACSGTGSCNGGDDGGALAYIQKNGVAVESCYKYKAEDGQCSEKCAAPAERITLGAYKSVKAANDDSLKSMILKGPVSCGWADWNHVITLIGYKVIAAGDTATTDHYKFITAKAGDAVVGKTAWQIKNSFGSNWGQKGFGYVTSPVSNLYPKLVTGPVKSLVLTEKDIVCEDKDRDGYFNWGIGPRPAACGTAAMPADGDDSDAKWGPMDGFGNLQPISATALADRRGSRGAGASLRAGGKSPGTAGVRFDVLPGSKVSPGVYGPSGRKAPGSR